MPIKTDCVIVGAGPCGLFQVFELGLLDIRAHVVDSLAQVGGQCSELYPDKPIYDIPALPVVGAQELIDRLMEQIKPFEPQFHLNQTVTALERRDDGRFTLVTSSGTEFDTATLVIAAGLGAFQPRRLKADGVERWEGLHIHYKVRDPAAVDGQDVLILGGGDSALDWALELHERARSLTLVHRRPEYRAAPASVSRMKELATAGRLRELQGTVRGVLGDEEHFGGLRVRDADGEEHELSADAAYVFYGLSPALGPIAEWGLEIDKRQLPVDTEKFQTSEPGIFAVGDINTYPGKKKLILSGFHEGALAAFAIKRHLEPNRKVHLQYTTTSPIMHERLGVAPAKSD
jgi:thioredoxin reductase (NADPH)